MANPNQQPDSGPSMSAAELRRRLLASTPPPLAATASVPDLDLADSSSLTDSAIVETPTAPSWANNSQQDLLARLRMPGKSGPVAVPTARTAPLPTPVVPTATPTRVSVNRRTPTPSSSLPAINLPPGSRHDQPPGSRHDQPGSRHDPASAIAGALNQLNGLSDGGNRYQSDDSPHAEIQRLRGENKELRTLLGEMKHLLQEASDTEQQLASKEKEFEDALAAKDMQLEELSAQLGAIEEQIAKGELAPPPPVAKTRSELEEWADELEKENAKIQQDRKRLNEERNQLREDEEALETQMREMEVAMARERALIARQETELRRLSAEIQHELELVQRGDTVLRDQMVKFQRRAQEVITKPTGGGNTNNGRR